MTEFNNDFKQIKNCNQFWKIKSNKCVNKVTNCNLLQAGNSLVLDANELLLYHQVFLLLHFLFALADALSELRKISVHF